MYNVFAQNELIAYFADADAAAAYARRVGAERGIKLVAECFRTGKSRNEWCKW